MDQPQVIPFGTAPDGQAAEKILLSNDFLSCQVLTYGATLQSLTVRDKAGNPLDVVLGYDNLEKYIREEYYFGATVGRVAGKLENGQFLLNGSQYQLSANRGVHHFHGGVTGFSHRVWHLEELSSSRAVLGLTSPHGEEGYPGNLQIWVEYALEGNALVIRHRAVSDRDTLCSLINHSYFNLAGQGAGPVTDHTLQIFAQNYTPTGENGFPLGGFQPVADTVLDFRHPRPIGTFLRNPQTNPDGPVVFYDKNFVLDGPMDVLRPAAVAHCPHSGITMTVATTLPGLQFYTPRFERLGHPGKDGAVYFHFYGFCLETQFFPDAPHHPAFPSIELKAGALYDHQTTYSFTTCE